MAASGAESELFVEFPSEAFEVVLVSIRLVLGTILQVRIASPREF